MFATSPCRRSGNGLGSVCRHTLFAMLLPLLCCSCSDVDEDALAQEVAEKIEPRLRAKIEAGIRRDMEARMREELRAELSLELERRLRATPIASRPRAAPMTSGTTPTTVSTASSPAPSVPDAPSTPSKLTLKVARHVIAEGIENRQPIAAATEFSRTVEGVVCYLEVDNRTGPERTLNVIWYRDGKQRRRVDLDIGRSRAWRTWAKIRIAEAPGVWRCDVVDEKGAVLSSAAFTVASEG